MTIHHHAANFTIPQAPSAAIEKLVNQGRGHSAASMPYHDLKQAADYFLEALKQTPEQHPYRVRILWGLAKARREMALGALQSTTTAHFATQRFQQTHNCLHDALQQAKAQLGCTHPWTVRVREKIVKLHEAQRDWTAAAHGLGVVIKNVQQFYDTEIAQTPPEAQPVLMAELAEFYKRMANHQVAPPLELRVTARTLFEKALPGLLALCGQDLPTVSPLAAAIARGDCLYFQGKRIEAESNYSGALHMLPKSSHYDSRREKLQERLDALRDLGGEDDGDNYPQKHRQYPADEDDTYDPADDALD